MHDLRCAPISSLLRSHYGHTQSYSPTRTLLLRVQQVAVMLDTKGPEIRTGFLQDHANVTITKGSTVELTTDYDFIGDATKIAVSYPELPQSVVVGGTVLVADGSLVLKILEVHDTYIIVRRSCIV